jgi:hypothetical protein
MAAPADFRCIGDADRCRSDPGRGHGAAACAYRKSNPDILVVQPAENWAAKNVPGPLDGARDAWHSHHFGPNLYRVAASNKARIISELKLAGPSVATIFA